MRFFPNVLLIIPPEEFALVKAFSKYANVYLYLVEHRRMHYFFHNLPAPLKLEYHFPDKVLGIIGKMMNRPHEVIGYRYVNITPSDIDLVFTTSTTTCRIDLKPFKNAIKVFWSIDCQSPRHFYIQTFSSGIQDYDLIFCSHVYCIDKFKEYGIKNICWLPLAYDNDIYKPLNLNKEIDLSIIMTLTKERRELLQNLKRKFSKLKIYAGNLYQHDANYIYNKSKIILNHSRMGEINMRCFEVLGCKGFMIINKINTEGLMVEGKHFVSYNTLNELFEKVEVALSNEEVRERVANAGYEEVSNKHTFYHRAYEVLKACKLTG